MHRVITSVEILSEQRKSISKFTKYLIDRKKVALCNQIVMEHHHNTNDFYITINF